MIGVLTIPRTKAWRPERRRLRTIFGEHEFRQYEHSAGAHRPMELRPIDARLGLSPRIGSYLLEEFTQLFCVETAFGQAARNFVTVFHQEVSMDTLEAIARRMGAAAETYADAMPPPLAAEEGELLVATMDAKGVPLIQEHPVPVKVFETRRLRPGNRRMATLAGVYSEDRHVRTPEQIVATLFRDESAAEPSRRPEPRGKHLTVHFPEVYQDGEDHVTSTGAIEACCWLTSEVDSRRRSEQPLLLLIDGDHRLWETAADHLPDDRIEILDIVHVSAYVWEAAGVLCTNEKAREDFTRSRLLTILRGGAKSVIRGLRHMATARDLRGDDCRQITTITNYLAARIDRLRYDEHLAAGYPIATGVIEGACRHLVKDPMERSGMRWTLLGAKAMLNLRAVIASGHWDEFQAQRREQEIQAIHPHRATLQDYQPRVALGTACGSSVTPVRLPPRSPNLNSHLERFMRIIGEECLDRMIFFGESSLWKGVGEFLTHYHGERNHQGLDNRIPLPGDEVGRSQGAIECRERLGGILRYYHRAA